MDQPIRKRGPGPSPTMAGRAAPAPVLFKIEPSFAPAKPQMPTAASDEFYTPSWLFNPLEDEFDFTVDAAATYESAKCDRFYSLSGAFPALGRDGLAQRYEGEHVWCNPPYSDIRPWAAKAVDSIIHGAECWVSPLPCWMDRKWWHEFVEPFRFHPDRWHELTNGQVGQPGHVLAAVEVELRFVEGRVAFGYPGNPEGNGAAGFDPTVIVIWRPRR